MNRLKLLLPFGGKQNRSPAERVRFWEEEVPGISEQCRLRRCEAFQGLQTMAEGAGFEPA